MRLISTAGHDLLLLFAGPIVWGLHFLAIYGFTGVACARPGAGPRWLGLAWEGWAVIFAGMVAVAVELQGHLSTPLRPSHSAYGAAVYMVVALQGFFVAIAACMGLYTATRSACGLLSSRRRQTFDNTMLFCHYTVAQGLLGLALVHGFARVTA